MNPAAISDLEAGFPRPLTDHEQLNAGTWLDRAWRKLVAHRPTLEADMLAGTVSTAVVIDVVCAMASRVLLNPEGKKDERIDDYSYGRSDSTSTGLLYVTSDELADITPGRRSSRSVRLVAYGQYDRYS